MNYLNHALFVVQILSRLSINYYFLLSINFWYLISSLLARFETERESTVERGKINGGRWASDVTLGQFFPSLHNGSNGLVVREIVFLFKECALYAKFDVLFLFKKRSRTPPAKAGGFCKIKFYFFLSNLFERIITHYGHLEKILRKF